MSSIPGQPDFSLPASVPSAQLSVAATRRVMDRAESFGGLLQQKLKTQIGNVLQGVAQGGATLELKAVTPISQVVGDAEQFHAQLVDSVHNDLAAKLAVAKVAAEGTPPPGPAGPGDCTNRNQIHPIGSQFAGGRVCGESFRGMSVVDTTTGHCAGVGRALIGTTNNPDALASCGGLQDNPDPTLWSYIQWPGETDPPMLAVQTVGDFEFWNDRHALTGTLADEGSFELGIQHAWAANSPDFASRCPSDCLPPPPSCPSWKVYSTTQTSNDCVEVCSTDPPPSGKGYLRGTFGTKTEADQYTSQCNNQPPPSGCCPAVVCPPPVVNCPSPPTCQYVSVCDLDSWRTWMTEFCHVYVSECVGKKGTTDHDLYNEVAWWQDDEATEITDPMSAWYGDFWDAIVNADDLLGLVSGGLSLNQIDAQSMSARQLVWIPS